MRLLDYHFHKCLTTMLLVVIGLGLSAQEISPFQNHQLLQDDSISLNLFSINGITIRRAPSNGSIVFTGQSGNQYSYQYTPSSGFTGQDTVTYEYWKLINSSTPAIHYGSIVFSVSALILKNDIYTISILDSNTAVSVLDNDISSNGLDLQAIVFQSNISASISGNNIIINPIEAGVAYLKYKACTDDDVCNIALLQIQVDPIQLPISIDLVEYTLKGKPANIYLGDGDFTLTSQPANGNVTVQNGVVTYLPSGNFTGSDNFTLVRDHSGNSTTYGCHIIVVQFQAPGNMVSNDQVNTVENTAIEFNVLDNDLINTRPIQSLTYPAHGSLTNLGGGDFVYTPNSGYIGTDFFTYKVCAMSNINCETALVSIRVDNYLPELSVYNFHTSEGQSFIIDYKVPVTDFDFSIQEYPLNGSLVYYSGENEINIQGENYSGYNFLVYTPTSQFTGVDEMRLNYCAGSQCKSIKLYVHVHDEPSDCIVDCVWSGDINRDGVVDVFDLLPLGFYNGHTGTLRNTANESIWLGYTSEDWDLSQRNGVNLKHADADGNGLVSVLDSASILTNYHAQNRMKSATINSLYSVPFILDLVTPEVEIGDTAIFNIIVGTSQYPAIDFTGLAFQLDFSSSNIFDTSSLKVTLYDDSWISVGGPSTDVSLKTTGDQIDAGISRLDGKYKSGFGIIGKFEGTIVRDIGGFHIGGDYMEVPVALKGGQIMSHDGIVYGLPDYHTSLKIKVGKGSNKYEPGFTLFPNPASDEVTLMTNKPGELIYETQVISLTGTTLHQSKIAGTNQLLINTSNWLPGVYIMRVLTSEGSFASKLQVSR